MFTVPRNLIDFCKSSFEIMKLTRIWCNIMELIRVTAIVKFQ